MEFASHASPDAPAVLSNARVLGEGIDVPAIDADPKNSPVDTVQAVGQQPGAGKKATLVVPVYLTPGEDPDDLLGADAYTPLWHTIQALRAHDDRLEARLAAPPHASPCLRTILRHGCTLTAPPRPKKSPSPYPYRSWPPRAPNGAAA
jgi:predicted helicase